MYYIGQEIQLLSFDRTAKVPTVIREVMVTVTDIKTGTPGHYTKTPSKMESLKAVDKDGNEYEKHWDRWPENQLNDFVDQWSPVIEGDDYWIPYEAMYVMQNLYSQKVKAIYKDTAEPVYLKGTHINLCEEHGYPEYVGVKCFRCIVEERRAQQAKQ